MNKKYLKSILDQEYEKRMRPLGFSRKKSQFIKSTNEYSYEFSYVIFDYGNVYIPEFSYGIKSKAYSNIVSAIYEKELNPFLYYIRQGALFENGEYPVEDYLVQNEDDVSNMINEIIMFFETKAMPYMASISSISALDKVINEKPKEPTTGIKGLILARLSGNPDYQKLKQTYRQFYIDRDWSIEEDIQSLEKTISFLENHTKEELQEIAYSNN